MQYDGSLVGWETPLTREEYEQHFIVAGSWENDRFIVPIDCMTHQGKAERWLCRVNNAVWVRVIPEEFTEHGMWKRHNIAAKGPFYRVEGSSYVDGYEKNLKSSGLIPSNKNLKEFLISSQENQVHILAVDEPTFEAKFTRSLQ
jgi:hypothetical protein